MRLVARARAAIRLTSGARLVFGLAWLGGFSVLAHAPFFFVPALVIALCILVLVLDDAHAKPKPLRSGFLRGWAFGFGQFLAGTHWVANAFLVNANEHAWLIWLPLLVFPAGLALFWGLAGAVYVQIAPKGHHRIVAFAVIFMAVEYARSTILSGFPWNLPAYVIEAGTPLSQSASILGAYGLSFWVLFACAAPIALLGRGHWIAKSSPVVLSALLLMSFWAYGMARLSNADDHPEATASFRLVAGTMAQTERTQDNRLKVLDHYLDLTIQPGLESVDAVIWPEGAIPTFLLNDQVVLGRIHENLPTGMRLIAGTPRWRSESSEAPEAFFNSLVVLEMGDRVYLEAVYDKAKLVPFGEANPLRVLTRPFGLESLSYWNRSYSAGLGQSSISFAGLPPVMVLICYEVVYPAFVRQGAQNAEWAINISNDSWFGTWIGPAQHANQVKYRAIESGLTIIRVASMGETGLIDPYGGVNIDTLIEKTATLDISVSKSLDYTFYGLYGELPWWVVSGIILFGNSLIRTEPKRS
jgi:apolipoprotein N-acyltransferase